MFKMINQKKEERKAAKAEAEAAKLAEIVKREQEIDREFIREYEELCMKYKRELIPQLAHTIRRGN